MNESLFNNSNNNHNNNIIQVDSTCGVLLKGLKLRLIKCYALFELNKLKTFNKNINIKYNSTITIRL